MFHFFFFFQAEDGIRDGRVTGVQTCALPICRDPVPALGRGAIGRGDGAQGLQADRSARRVRRGSGRVRELRGLRPDHGENRLSRAGLTVRALNAQDDLGPEYDLRHRAFGPITGEVSQAILDDLAECVAESRLLGAWDDGILVGTARYYDMAQWWHGRSQPMAGVGGVKVAPEARARGVGKALMTGLLAAMSERGYPLSALYPATPHLYRSLGWELAGSQYLAEMPCRTLTSLRDPDPRVAAAARSEEHTSELQSPVH